jgi:hypothetical protein
MEPFLVLACTAACGGDDGRGPVDPPVAIGDSLPHRSGDQRDEDLATPSLQYDSVVVYRFTPAVPTEVALYLKTTGGAANLRVTFARRCGLPVVSHAQPLLTYRRTGLSPGRVPARHRVTAMRMNTGADCPLFRMSDSAAPEHVPAT